MWPCGFAQKGRNTIHGSDLRIAPFNWELYRKPLVFGRDFATPRGWIQWESQHQKHRTLVVLSHPSEKWWSESQLGWWHSQYDGKEKSYSHIIQPCSSHQPDIFSQCSKLLVPSFLARLLGGFPPRDSQRDYPQFWDRIFPWKIIHHHLSLSPCFWYVWNTLKPLFNQKW